MRVLILLLCLLPTAVLSLHFNNKCSKFNTHDFYTDFNEDVFYDCVDFNEGSLIWQKDNDGSIPLFKLLSSDSETLNYTYIDRIFDVIGQSKWQDLQSLTDNRGRNAIMISVESSLNWEYLARLISYEGEVEQTMPDSEESLVDFATSINGNENIVALLVALGGKISDKNLKDKVSDMQAILKKEDWAKKVNTLNYSSYKSPVFNCNGENLIKQIQHIDPSIIKYCATSNTDFINYIDRDGNSLLHLVAQYGSNPKVIDAILNNFDEENIKRLVSSTNSSGRTALHLAAKHSNEPAMVSRLLAWGSDPNVTNERWSLNPFKKTYKTTPLHTAARRTDDYEGVMMLRLIAGGADVFAQDKKGDTALHILFKSERVFAPYIGMINGVQYAKSRFYQRKAPEIQNMKGYTPLVYAVAKKNNPTLVTIREMLKSEANPDIKIKDGWTPLLVYAFEGDNANIFELLLDHSDNACEQMIAKGPGKGSTIEALLNKNTNIKDSKTKSGKYTMAVFKEKCPN